MTVLFYYCFVIGKKKVHAVLASVRTVILDSIQSLVKKNKKQKNRPCVFPSKSKITTKNECHLQRLVSLDPVIDVYTRCLQMSVQLLVSTLKVNKASQCSLLHNYVYVITTSLIRVRNHYLVNTCM